MNDNLGKGSNSTIFLGVVGVLTLIVAITGATFAYFSATTTSGEYVTGTAATSGLSVHATRLTGFSAAEIGKDASTASYIMVPQPDSTLSQAIVGTDGKACIDANGSLVCTIYKITVTNTGSAAIDVNGTIVFKPTDALLANSTEDESGKEKDDAYTDATSTNSKMKHLKWARLVNPADVSGSTLPTALASYSGGENPYFYAIENTTAIQDYLGGVKRNGTNAAYYDLIKPEDDLTKSGTDPNSNYVLNTANPAPGSVHLEAVGTTIDANNDSVKDDTATYYIVVWISENQASQNEDDVMSFAGQITFESTEGSGATSSFTETALVG